MLSRSALAFVVFQLFGSIAFGESATKKPDVGVEPFGITSDLNNDRKIDAADDHLKVTSLGTSSTNLTPDDIENGTEYVFVNDNLSNGLWDKDDPAAPPGTKEDDDVRELKTVCSGTEGAVWFDYEGSPMGNTAHMEFYKSRECTAENHLTFPMVLCANQTAMKR